MTMLSMMNLRLPALNKFLLDMVKGLREGTKINHPVDAALDIEKLE
jgi:hypothetical protein